MRVVAAALAFFVFAVLAALGVRAEDVVRLKNGGEIRGHVVEESEETITIVPSIGGRMVLRRSHIREIVRGEGVEPTPEPEGKGEMQRRATFLVHGPGRAIRGWREQTVWKSDGDTLYESDTVFLEDAEEADDGKGVRPAVRVRVVERVGPDHVARSFTYHEQAAGRPEVMRRGEVAGKTLRLMEATRGSSRRRSVPFPAGTRFPSAARASVLERRDELEKGLQTATFDPVTGTFGVVQWTSGGKEAIEHDGRSVEVWVLRSTREGVTSEERLDAEGRTLSAHLNGPSLTAVAVDRSRLERFKEGHRPGGSEAERRSVHVDAEAGFSIRKLGTDWTFEKGAGMRRITLKHLETFAYVDVIKDSSLPKGTRLETFALNLQRRLAADSEGFRKDSDDYAKLGGERAYRLVAESRLKGEDIRSLVVATIHGDAAWIVIAACPVDYWTKARRSFDRIVESFEFVD